MDKSVGAFRTISEVADDLDLPQHVLRFWETRFPQIRPLKRAGGRRYYRPADVELLRVIRDLLYDQGYTIKGVQRLLRERGARGTRDGSPAEASCGPDADAAVLPAVQPAEEPSPSNGGWRPGPASGAAGERDEAERAAAADPRDDHPASLRSALVLIEECEHLLRMALSPVD